MSPTKPNEKKKKKVAQTTAKKDKQKTLSKAKPPKRQASKFALISTNHPN